MDQDQSPQITPGAEGTFTGQLQRNNPQMYQRLASRQSGNLPSANDEQQNQQPLAPDDPNLEPLGRHRQNRLYPGLQRNVNGRAHQPTIDSQDDQGDFSSLHPDSPRHDSRQRANHQGSPRQTRNESVSRDELANMFAQFRQEDVHHPQRPCRNTATPAANPARRPSHRKCWKLLDDWNKWNGTIPAAGIYRQ